MWLAVIFPTYSHRRGSRFDDDMLARLESCVRVCVRVRVCIALNCSERMREASETFVCSVEQGQLTSMFLVISIHSHVAYGYLPIFPTKDHSEWLKWVVNSTSTFENSMASKSIDTYMYLIFKSSMDIVR